MMGIEHVVELKGVERHYEQGSRKPFPMLMVSSPVR
ncbi:hypothetical protein J2X13_000564 [Aminobacter aminovorans]|nr:hypothetical protein [Aminobacter aminovorans]